MVIETLSGFSKTNATTPSPAKQSSTTTTMKRSDRSARS